jgi:hypothetical protein
MMATGTCPSGHFLISQGIKKLSLVRIKMNQNNLGIPMETFQKVAS